MLVQLAIVVLMGLNTVASASSCVFQCESPGNQINITTCSYPDDALEHTLRINREIGAFFKGLKRHDYHGYYGMWIENHWIDSFKDKVEPLGSTAKLKEHFGPYIPLLTYTEVDCDSVRTTSVPKSVKFRAIAYACRKLSRIS